VSGRGDKDMDTYIQEFKEPLAPKGE